MKPRVCVITGYGINSDFELEHCFGLAGGDARRVHINDLISGSCALSDFDILAVPGGFSFGDHIASGRVFANKLKHFLGDELQKAVAKGVPVIGICNGFQVLVKLGLLPGTGAKAPGENATDGIGASTAAALQQTCTLTFNDSGRFEDRWCHLKAVAESPCIWTRGIDLTYLPVRHGEGKFVPGDDAEMKRLRDKGMICLRYTTATGGRPDFPGNPNGSVDDVAGICNESGLVFGLMPHPEAHMHATNHPQWLRLGLRGEGEGLKFFRNAVDFVKSRP